MGLAHRAVDALGREHPVVRGLEGADHLQQDAHAILEPA